MSRLVIKLVKSWDRFWFKEESTEALGIFRIFFGFYLLLVLILSFHNFEYYFGQNGFYPLSEGFLKHLSEPPILWGVYWLGIVFSLTFIIGFHTRLLTVILYLIFLFLFHRNPFVISGEDEVHMTLLFFSCFATLGASYSLDELFKKISHYRDLGKPYHSAQKSVWPLRLIQTSIVLIYFFTGLGKLVSDPIWRDGTAFYYVSQFDHWFAATNIELFHNLLLSKVFTYGTLFLEIGFPILIIFRRTRFYLLAGGLMMHLFMIFFFVKAIGLFALVMLVSYILLIPSLSWHKFINALFKPKDSRHIFIFYDNYCGFCRNVVYLLQALDSYKRLEFFNLQNPQIYQKFPQFKQADLERELHLLTAEGKVLKGFFAFRYLTHTISGLYLLAPIFYFPGASLVGPWVYKWVADNRSKYFYCHSCGLKHGGSCALKPQKA